MSIPLIYGRKYINETKLFSYLNDDAIAKWNSRYLKSRIITYELARRITITSPSEKLRQCQSKVPLEQDRELKRSKTFFLSKKRKGGLMDEQISWIASLSEIVGNTINPSHAIAILSTDGLGNCEKLQVNPRFEGCDVPKYLIEECLKDDDSGKYDTQGPGIPEDNKQVAKDSCSQLKCVKVKNQNNARGVYRTEYLGFIEAAIGLKYQMMFITDPAEDAINGEKKGRALITHIASILFTEFIGPFDWNAEKFLREIGSRWCFCACTGGPCLLYTSPSPRDS